MEFIFHDVEITESGIITHDDIKVKNKFRANVIHLECE